MDRISCILTGSTGFLGKNLTNYLSSENIELVHVSVRDPIDDFAFLSCDSIVHLAGKAHDTSRTSKHDHQAYDKVNYEVTKNLFDVFLASKTKKFIFVSSIKAVADFPKGIVTEDYIPNPKTAYGISKLKAENYLLSQILPSDKQLYILRPCMIHGNDNKGNLNLLYKFVQKRIPYPLSLFQNKRSYLSVDNFCFTVKNLLLRDDIPSGIYNVADDKSLSTKSIIELIASILERKVLFLSINKKLIFLLAKIGDFFHLPFNSERLNKMVSNFEVSNQKLIKVLGLPFPINAEEGFIKTILSIKEKTIK